MSSAEAPRPWRRTTAPRALSSGCPLETTGCLRCGLSTFLALFRKPNSDWRQCFLDFTSVALQPQRKLQALAKAFDRLDNRKSRRVRGHLEQHTAGLAEVNGME